MRWRAGSVYVMKLYMPTKFLLVILQRTFRSLYEPKTNIYSSVDHNHVSRSGMTKAFHLKRQSSDNHYKKFRKRYSTVQIVIVILDPLRFAEVIQYKIYKTNYAKISLDSLCLGR